MKKVGLVLVAVLMLVLVAGCGKKQTLSCTQTPLEGYLVEFNVGFKGSMIETMDYKYVIDLSSNTDAEIENVKVTDFCSKVKDSMEAYKDAFKDCKQDVKDKTLYVSAGFDVDKLANSAADRMGKIEDAKKELEGQGFACTIK